MKTLLLLLCLMTSLFGSSITVPGSLTHEHSLKPEQVIEGSIPIQNETDSSILVRVSLSDYLFNAKGESFFPEAGINARSNASWIKTGESQITVAPHTTYSYAYTLTVPDESLLEGTYWSIFLVEPIEDPLKEPDKEKALGIQTIIRYGVQIITHLGEKGTYELKVLEKRLNKEENKKTFSLSVENEGSLMQAPSFTLELVNSEGKKAAKLEAVKQRILPSCSVTYTVDLPDLPKGKYKALALLDDSEEAFFGAQYELDIE